MATQNEIENVATAARSLADNWMEGATARAMCRDRLVDAMVAAGLIDGPCAARDDLFDLDFEALNTEATGHDPEKAARQRVERTARKPEDWDESNEREADKDVSWAGAADLNVSDAIGAANARMAERDADRDRMDAQAQAGEFVDVDNSEELAKLGAITEPMGDRAGRWAVTSPRPLAISAEEHSTRLWLEALVAVGWSIANRWWEAAPDGATLEEKTATVCERERMDPLTVDEAINLMRDPVVRTYEFTGPGSARFSICGRLF